MCVPPALAMGVLAAAVVVVVCVVTGSPVVIAAAAFVVVTAGAAVMIWFRAPSAILSAIGAVPSHEERHPRLHNLVDGLCATMGLPRPTICVVESPRPNALALGRAPDHAYLVVTSGLDQALNLVELEGVLAHELVHVKRQDTVLAGTAMMSAALESLVVGLSRGTERVHRLVGPGREYRTDQRAASIVRYPPGIGSALEIMTLGTTQNGTTELGTTQNGTRQGGTGGPQPPSVSSGSWPPGRGRLAILTRWLWIDPLGGEPADAPTLGDLDDTRVRAEVQSLI